jgi:hypothetical protein
MMAPLHQLFWAVAPSLLTSIALGIFSHRMRKASQHREQAERNRRKEAKLNLDLTFATAQLAYAVAMAMKRGHPNGEVEQGVQTYEAALTAYRKFEREQLADSITE